MAEPTKVKIYNFGDRKLDYGKYITNLENNVESYLQNQRDTEGWDDNRAQEFRNAFGEIISHFRGDYQGNGTRFSTNQMGSIVDSEGVLNDTDGDDYYYNNKGEKINRELYDALKDKKRRRYNSFEANREVAEYFRRIGSYMKDYEDTTEKFDITKHGFSKWLMDREAPGGTFNYQNYWDLDPVDAKTGKRDTKNRADQAKKWMKDYIADMGKRTDLSFEGNAAFPSLEDYLLKAKDVETQWGNGNWDAMDKITAQRLGIDNDFMTKFFGTEGTPDTTPEENAEIAALRAQQAKEEEEKKSTEAKEREYKAWVDSQYNDHVSKKYRYSKQVPYYANLYSWDKYYKDGQLTDEYHRMLGNLVVYHKGHNKSIMQMDEKEKGEVLGQLLNQYVNHLYDPKYNIGDISPNNHYIYLLQLLDQHYALDLGNGTYYIPATTQSNSALIFDLNAKTFYHTFIGDIPSVWELRKLEYYNRVNGVSPSSQYYEEGGIIKAQDGAALLNAGASKYFANRAQQRHDQLQAKATAKGRTIEQQELAERKAHTPFAGFEDDNTWSTEEYARLTAAGADITAAIAAFVPGYGTAVSGIAGVGSTIANAIADKADDSVSTGQWWKNLGMNLGMDVLGLVPGVGAAGKFTKILRNIGRTIPRIIAVLGTMGAFLNSDAIMASLKKSISDPANLTVEDWQNIAQGIGVATGLAAGTGRHLQRKAKEAGSTTDFAAIRMRSKTNPKIVENKIVGAKTARDLRAAKTNDEIREILYRDNPWLKDTYDLDIKGGLYGRELTWKRPTWADKSPIGTKESLAKIYDVRRDAKGNLYGYTGRWKSDLALYGDRSRDAFGRVRMQSYQNKGRGTMLADEKMAYMEDLGRIRDQVGTPLDRTGTRRVGNADDFNEAFWKSRRDLEDTPDKSRLLQDQQDIRKYYEEQQKPFRDQHGSTTDITGRLNAAKTLKGSPDYQTAVGQHATLTQQHADLVARHQPMIDSYKQQIQQIDNDLVFYNSQRTAASAKDRALANREIKRLTKLRQQLQSEHDTLAAELLASETKVKNNQAKIDEGSDTRIAELEALETQSKAHDETLANIDKQISRLEQLGGKHTPSYVELMDKRAKDGKITFTDERGKQFSVDAIRAMRLAGIKKNGGILDAVEKFQAGKDIKSPMRDVLNKGNVNWYTDMFTNGLNATKTSEDGTILPNWFDKWTVDNIDQFNQLQTDWHNNLQATGYQEGSNKAVRNPGVMDRQPRWEATGGNAPIAEMLSAGRLVGNGGTLDKPGEDGKFGADGVFGQQEYLRHAGRASDWEGKDAELAEFNKKLAERGLVYEKDRSGNTDMMMLYKLDEKPKVEEPKVDEPPKKKGNSVVNLPKLKKLKDLGNGDGGIFSKPRQYLGDPDLLANLQLFGTLNQIQDEVDLLRKKLPHLLQVGDDHKYVRKNNAAIYNARKAQGLLMHMASQPIVSDGGQLMAYYADQFTKMLDYGLQGDQLADEKFWETMDAEKELRMKGRKAREDNANANSRTLAEHQHDWINTLLVARYKKWNALNTRLMEMRAKMLGEADEAKAAQKAADRTILENDITFNLQKYAKQFDITPEEITVWNKVQAGTVSPSKLPANEIPLWESVYRKVQLGKQLLTALQSGADISAYANVRSMTKPSTPTNPTAHDPNTPGYVRLNKEGGKTAAKAKIKVAKIRERIKNADRVARAMEKNLDRVLKTVDGISKRMYGIKR